MSPLELENISQTKSLPLDEFAVETHWMMSTSDLIEDELLSAGFRPRLAAPRFSGYTDLELIGQGGFGAVYRARHELLERRVALKVLMPQHDDSGAGPARERLLNEARILARFRHPNIPILFGVLEEEGQMALVTELIDGPSLSKLLQIQGPLGAGESACMGIEICKILGDLHRSNIVHGDLKTSNLLREREGRIVLTDFGLSQRLDSRSQWKGAGHITGSPLFMAPEQIQGIDLNLQTDIYGLGVVLYHLATGRFPAGAETLPELFAQITSGTTIPIETWRPDLHEPFRRAVHQAMARKPCDRFQTAGEMEQALADCI